MAIYICQVGIVFESVYNIQRLRYSTDLLFSFIFCAADSRNISNDTIHSVCNQNGWFLERYKN